MTQRTLPPDATEASRTRHELARELANRCPPQLGREIAVTGSVSRGVADEDSDIELIAWVDDMPTRQGRVAWLKRIGATDIGAPHTSADGTVWEWSRFAGFWLETGWQSISQHAETLSAIVKGEVTDHWHLVTADAVVHAVMLRSEGLLEDWQKTLVHYPDVLRERLIAAATRRWTYALAYWSLARRNDRVGALERLLADVQSVLRILFAVNRVWEPTWKWAAHSTRTLSVKPERLAERMDKTLSTSDLEDSLATCAELVAETLALVPGEIDVSAARACIERSLRQRAP